MPDPNLSLSLRHLPPLHPDFHLTKVTGHLLGIPCSTFELGMKKKKDEKAKDQHVQGKPMPDYKKDWQY